jgi:hypothetical protein
VRRSWLCGLDGCIDKRFEYRKPWVEARILELGAIFSCGIYAGAFEFGASAPLFANGFE